MTQGAAARTELRMHVGGIHAPEVHVEEGRKCSPVSKGEICACRENWQDLLSFMLDMHDCFQ